MQGKYYNKNVNLTLLCLTACICQNLYAATELQKHAVLLPTLKVEATRTDTDGCKRQLRPIGLNKTRMTII